jgi:hypothetical protein
MVLFGGGAKSVEHDSGLYTGDAAAGIDFENARHVLGKIQNDGDVAALSGEGGASATAKKRRAKFAAERDGRENILGVARKNDSNRNLAVVGAIRRVEGARARVEANFAADLRAESGG